jgi:hypothetical protein
LVSEEASDILEKSTAFTFRAVTSTLLSLSSSSHPLPFSFNPSLEAEQLHLVWRKFHYQNLISVTFKL